MITRLSSLVLTSGLCSVKLLEGLVERQAKSYYHTKLEPLFNILRL